MCMRAGTLKAETQNERKDTENDKERIITGVPSGFAKQDEITSGFQKSDLIVVASRPGMGKTSFALNIARDVAVLKECNVLYFTQEMKQSSLVQGILSAGFLYSIP